MKTNREHSLVMKWINTGTAAALMLLVLLANLIPIGLGTTGAVAGQYAHLLSPAPVTYLIWGLLGLFVMGFVLYQWGFFDKKGNSQTVSASLGPWFSIGCLLAMGWLLTWHLGAMFPSLILLALLTGIIAVAERITLHRDRYFADHLWAGLGFRLGLGWLIFALFENLGAWFTKIGGAGFGLSPAFWATVGALAIAALGVLTVLTGFGVIPSVSLIWGLTGLLIRHLDPAALASRHPTVIVAAIVAIVILSCGVIIKLFSEIPDGSAFKAAAR